MISLPSKSTVPEPSESISSIIMSYEKRQRYLLQWLTRVSWIFFSLSFWFSQWISTEWGSCYIFLPNLHSWFYRQALSKSPVKRLLWCSHCLKWVNVITKNGFIFMKKKNHFFVEFKWKNLTNVFFSFFERLKMWLKFKKQIRYLLCHTIGRLP